MNFRLVQHFESDAESVNRAYADPDLYPTLVGLPKLGGIEVVGADGDPAHHLEVRFRFTGDLPSAVTAVVAPDRLTWVQESIHDHAARSARFRLLPDHYPDRLRCRGNFQVDEVDGGSRRTITGELQVRAPLVASRVEQAIVSGLEEYLMAEAPALDAWIRGPG
ncbi:MAG: DUF2505 family protein [Microthrixaceae bacterium]|jgi:hypothetical protein|nr:DUF2505 family protein [Microthrixaceae bacterium]